jgi:hypothetical protein
MWRYIMILLLATTSSLAQGQEIPWRSQSLSAAREICRTDPSKHILVFYTDYKT